MINTSYLSSKILLLILVASLLTLFGGSVSAVIVDDDFNRPSLGSDWVIDNGSFNILGDALQQNAGQKHTTSQLRYVAETTSTPDQFGKLRIVSAAAHTFGFMFRNGSTPGAHYEVHLPKGNTQWRWERYNPSYVERLGDCVGSGPITDGIWAGATVEGAGASTLVSVWLWNGDPDQGGAVDIVNNWGSPDCTMMSAGPVFVDSGNYVGIRAYTGNSTASGFADDWTSGDVSTASTFCGDGILEIGEACDDGNTTSGDGCRSDCTLEICGDGILDTGESCDDGNLVAGDGCDEFCEIEPAICGNNIIEGSETCDDGNTVPGDGCDASCMIEPPVCGNNVIEAPETCDDGNTLPGDGCNEICEIETSTNILADNFNRPTLGSDWVIDNGSFNILGDALQQNAGQTYTTSQLRYVAETTSTPDQFGKLRIVSAAAHTFGFMFRNGPTPGAHYEVHLPKGNTQWRWERYNPSYVERLGDCVGSGPITDGIWAGATVEGAGASALVSVWLWNGDPDLGGDVDIANNWGPPDCTMTSAGPVFVDSGNYVGIRAYTGNSTASGFADDWTAGDVSTASTVCGDGILEIGEDCDDGNTTSGDGCRADCTLEICGDGVLDPGETCDDGNLLDGDGCRADCTVEICGDGVVDPGETCDDGNTSGGDGCRADCTLEICGDGVLDPGETCDDGNNIAGDGCDDFCNLEPSTCGDGVVEGYETCDDGNTVPGDGCDASCNLEQTTVYLGDDFNQAVLGSNWSVHSGSYALSNNVLTENSGSRHTNTQLVYVGEPTATSDQFGKLQIVSQATHGFGFIFRSGDTPGAHYQVHPQINNAQWRWERHDPSFVERLGECFGDFGASNGDWIGAAISGAGSQTTVYVWRWDSDPDSGQPVDIEANWGAPDCAMVSTGLVFVDSGNYTGIRAYTGNSSAAGFVDNWSAGDFDGNLPPPPPSPPWTVDLIFDQNGSSGTPNSARDPDGVAIDAQGNVYIAACGYSLADEGVFKIEPDGTKSKLMGGTGDGTHLATCPVGLDLDSNGNLYVAAYLSDNVFKIDTNGVITQVIDSTGAGDQKELDAPLFVTIDRTTDSVYVTGNLSDNVLALRSDGSIEEIIDVSGNGQSSLVAPFGAAVDSTGNLYVAGRLSDNVFQVSTTGAIQEVMDSTGGGVAGGLDQPHSIIFDAADNMFVTGNRSDNVIMRTPSGVVTEIIDATGDGAGNVLDNPTCIDVGDNGNVFVAAFASRNVFEITPSLEITEIMDGSGDGVNPFYGPSDDCLEVEGSDRVYALGTIQDKVFLITRQVE